jgi:hypothetical protein
MNAHDRADVERTARSYIESWFAGDADGMGRALHPELVKRSLGGEAIATLTAQQMVDYTAGGGGSGDPTGGDPVEVTVDRVDGDIATATVVSAPYLDYMQLVRTPEGWRILNVLWLDRLAAQT